MRNISANSWPLVGTGLCLAGAVVAAIVFKLVFWPTPDTPPTDAELLANFAGHRSAFQRLAEMGLTDKKLIRVDEHWTEPEFPATVGVSAARIQLYRSLAKEADVPRGFTRTGYGAIEFMYWGLGITSTGGIDKGYAYWHESPSKDLPSLDGFKFPGKVRETVYRHIDGPWYLYYENVP